jgi:hypothetical protein
MSINYTPTYEGAIELADELCSRGRSHARTVRTVEFKDIFELVDNKLKLEAIAIIQTGTPDELRGWMQKNTTVTFDNWSLAELRKYAKNLRIRGSSKMNTAEIISAIKRVEK